MYQPEEDSFFLANELEKYLKNNKIKTFLDLGTGSGIQAKTASKYLIKKNILCADISQEAVNHVKKLRFPAVKSNLFSNIKCKFNLIVFNPPYLPENKHDKQKDTTGGKQGDETILAFLKQAKNHLSKNGKILLLISSMTPKARIQELLAKQKFKKKILASKKLFFETLEVWQIS